ncbi:DegT/DnrJ/EryC1/StrS family aminotransferase [candidate division WOR-3 bacterium]|nr:DegT/DnrJ/EryC1/StrS family aminotransferase [candidate division WOR-3 bacterium]
MIPVFRPSMGDEEIREVGKVIKSGWIGLGPKTKEFEEKFAEYVGSKYAVGTNSATAALHLALKVADVEGNEVITTPMTFISTNHAILYNNAIPVFADIEEDTLNIRVDEIEKLITPGTKAILVVHYGGHPCDMEPILEIVKDKNIKIIEDAAHACGAEYKGRKIGSIGDVTFSFHAVKNLATGDGGMITFHDKDIDARLRKLRWLGINKSTYDRSIVDNKYSWYYNIEELGYKYHMNDIAAAIGLVQLKKLDRMNAKRREIVKAYDEAFKDLDWIKLPVENDYAKSSWHIYAIKVENGKRDELINYLAKNGMSASVHYIPNHLYSMYKPYYRKLPVAETVWKKLATFPSYPDMEEAEIEKVIQVVREFNA